MALRGGSCLTYFYQQAFHPLLAFAHAIRHSLNQTQIFLHCRSCDDLRILSRYICKQLAHVLIERYTAERFFFTQQCQQFFRALQLDDRFLESVLLSEIGIMKSGRCVILPLALIFSLTDGGLYVHADLTRTACSRYLFAGPQAQS